MIGFIFFFPHSFILLTVRVAYMHSYWMSFMTKAGFAVVGLFFDFFFPTALLPPRAFWDLFSLLACYHFLTIMVLGL